MIMHMQLGNSTNLFNGSAGWFAELDRPVLLLPMEPGADVDGARLDAALGFPGGIKQALSDWKVGFPSTTIDDQVVNILGGTAAGKSRVKLFFDAKTGLLARRVVYRETPIGTVPAQVDYSDYREVAGVKLPFHIAITWTDGQSDMVLTEIQPNVPIDAAKFAKPAAAVRKK